MDDLCNYSTDENINNADKSRINLSIIHKNYTPNEIRYTLCYPRYMELYNKIKVSACSNMVGNMVVSRNINNFRLGVQATYPNGCPITKVSNKLTDLAHIVPYATCESFEQDDPCNGIRLDMRIHRLWDSADNWLELHIIDTNSGTVEFRIPERHINNLEIINSVKDFINKPITGLSINTIKYISRRLIQDLNKF